MRQLKKLRDESGQAMTEFALVLPLLFVLLFAIAEGGLTLNRYLQLTDAVRVGARIASVNASQGPVVAQSAAASAMTPSVDGLQSGDVHVTAPAWTTGQPVTVQAKLQYSVTLPLFGTIASGWLTSQSVQRIE